MGYRDELEAAHARSEALKRELAEKDAEIDDLEDKLSDKAESEKATRKAKRRSGIKMWWPWALLSVVMMAGVGGIVVYCVGMFSQKIEGQFEAKGAQLGDWVIAPDGCDSGQRNGFSGVDLFGGGLRFRLAETVANGPALIIQRGDKRLALLSKKDCKTFDRSVRKTNTTVNDVRLLDGHLELDCQLPMGGTLRGKVTFENCR